MFKDCTALNDSDLENWDVSDVGSMDGMFQGATSFNQDLGGWDVSDVSSMSYMFEGAASFNQDISEWFVGSVYTVKGMFKGATSFNQDIGGWDVSGVTNMKSIFAGASSFNRDIGGWNVNNVNNMEHMFNGALNFNQDISNWNVANVTNMFAMFKDASSFNQDIAGWDMSNVRYRGRMFYNAISFDQDIGDWDISNLGGIDSLKEMFTDVSLSTANYDNILNKWAAKNELNNINFSGGNSKYSADAGEARQSLIDDYNWNITDGGLVEFLIDNLSPADDSDDHGLADNLIITFNQKVNIGTGYITIYKADGSLIERIDVTDSAKVSGAGSTTITINPDTTLAEITDFYVQIDRGAFTDELERDFAGIADTTSWNFKTVINIPDPALKNALLAHTDPVIDSNGDGEIKQSEAEVVEILSLAGKGIADLTGLNHFTSLNSLYLEGNNISDIGPLAHLTSLNSLNLEGNNISDISSLTNLSSIKELNLASNHLSEFSPLESLNDLTELDLGNTGIENLELFAENIFPDLMKLILDNNQLNDEAINPLTNYSSLTILNLENNSLSDISPLENLSSLSSLNLAGNTLSAFSPLESLNNLTELDLGNTGIENLELFSENIFPDLTKLILNNNQLNDADLNSIIDLNLSYLDLEGNNINSLDLLTNITTLTTLNLANNYIKDMRPIKIINLDALDISGNPLYGSDGDDTSNLLQIEDSYKLRNLSGAWVDYQVFVPQGTVTASNGLTERELNGATIDLEIYPTTFKDDELDPANFSLGDSLPPGLSIDSVEYLNERECRLNLVYDGTDFDTDIPLLLKIINSDGYEIVRYDEYGYLYHRLSFPDDSPTITANDDPEVITIADDGSLVLGAEDGEVITVEISGGEFSQSITHGNWQVKNLPAGVTVCSINRINNITVEITLLGNSLPEDYSSDITDLTVSVPASDYVDSSGGSDLTADTGVIIQKKAIDYNVSIDQEYVNINNETAISFTFTGAEIDSTYNYSIDDEDDSTAAVTGSGTFTSEEQTVTGIDVSGLSDDILVLNISQRDENGDTINEANTTVRKDTVEPVLSTLSISSDNGIVARAEDKVIVSITASEELIEPTVTVAGHPADIIDDGDNDATTWQAEYTMQSGDSEGEVAFTVEHEDIAGNSGNQVINTTDNSQVIFVGSEGHMELVFDTTLRSGTTIELPLQGIVDVAIDWDDGSSEVHTVDDKIRHHYASEGTYTVTIAGGFGQFGYGEGLYDGRQQLVAVKDFGCPGNTFTSLSGAFYEANNLSEVPDTLPDTVEDLSYCFAYASSFDQDISSWDVSNVTNMFGMFGVATSFDQDLNDWDISNVTDMSYMFSGVTLSTANYNSILQGWAAQNVQNGVAFDAGNSKYSSLAAEARQSLTDDHGWSITDGGLTPLPAVSTQPATDITETTATGNGSINDLGSSASTQYGVCWNTSGDPTIADNHTEEGSVSSTGTFTSAMAGLTPGTTYYIRAYATNTAGTSYGSEVSFTTTANQQPTIAITNPTENLLFGNEDIISISGTVIEPDNNEVFISATIDGEIQSTAISGGNGDWTLEWDIDNLNINEGIYTDIIINADNGNGGNDTAKYTGNIEVDRTAPSILSGTLAADNSYVDVEFSEGVYGADDGITALTSDKLGIILNPNGGSATNAIISSLKQDDNTDEESASALTGGETTVRVFMEITGIPDGNETIEITPVDAAAIYDKAGNVVTINQTTGEKKLNDYKAPEGYSVNIGQEYINYNNQAEVSIAFSGAEVGATYNYSINDKKGATSAVTGSGMITVENQTVTGIDLSSLSDGQLSLTATLTDAVGNIGEEATATVEKDTVEPEIVSLSPAVGAEDVNIYDNLEIKFNEIVEANSGSILIKKTANDSIFETIDVQGRKISGSGTDTITISPHQDLAGDTGYYILIENEVLKDRAGNSFSGLKEKIDWNFKTTEEPEIQLSMTDSYENGETLAAGETITYNITIRNTGLSSLKEAEIIAQIPSNTAYVKGTTKLNGQTIIDDNGNCPLLEGYSINSPGSAEGVIGNQGEIDYVSVSYQVKVISTVVSGTIISNQLKVDGMGENSYPVRAVLSDDPDTEVVGDPTISPVGEAAIIDASRQITGEDGDKIEVIEAGDTLQCNTIIRNIGSREASEIILTDPIPEHTTLREESLSGTPYTITADNRLIIELRSLSPGAEISILYQISVDNGVDEADRIISQGTISSADTADEKTDADGNDSNGDQPNEMVVGINPLLTAIMRVKDINGGDVKAGDILEYTIKINNGGNTAAEELEIINQLPAELQYISGSTELNGFLIPDDTGDKLPLISEINYGLIEKGETVEVKYQAKIPDDTEKGIAIENQAGYTAVARAEDTGSLEDTLLSGTTDICAVQPGGTPGAVNISGRLESRVGNPVEGWKVQIWADDNILGDQTLVEDGVYSFSGLSGGSSYRLQVCNPENNVVYNQIEKSGLTEGSIDYQNIYMDPSGIIYNSITREKVAGAIVTLVDETGTTVPAEHLYPGQQNQVTGADGFYRFDLDFNQADAGKYTIRIENPEGYLDNIPSNIIKPTLDPSGEGFDPTGRPDPYKIVESNTAPAHGDDNSYYLSFELEPGDPDLLNNHIPIDPVEVGTILDIKKTANKSKTSIGEFISYRLVISNNSGNPVDSFTVFDLIPAGFKYVEESAVVEDEEGNNEIIESADNRLLSWGGLTLNSDEKITITYTLVVGTGVIPNEEYLNQAYVKEGDMLISNTAEASVLVMTDPILEASTIIGKVFIDENANGIQDHDEDGIEGVEIISLTGQTIITDEYGRYHLIVEQGLVTKAGKTVILKLDKSTLPGGAVVISNNPVIIKLSAGLMQKVNFSIQVSP